MNTSTVMGVILIAVASAAVLKADAVQQIDYQKTADDAAWTFDMKRAGIPGTMVGWDSKYDISFLYSHEKKGIVISILDDNKTVYSWVGSRWTVFQIMDNHLYYADFGPGGGGGGQIIAVDLTTGKELWHSKLLAFSTQPPTPASSTVLMMNLSVNQDVVTILGWEMGRYIEFKDIKTGKTVGHKIFPGQPETQSANPTSAVHR